MPCTPFHLCAGTDWRTTAGASTQPSTCLTASSRATRGCAALRKQCRALTHRQEYPEHPWLLPRNWSPSGTTCGSGAPTTAAQVISARAAIAAAQYSSASTLFPIGQLRTTDGGRANIFFVPAYAMGACGANPHGCPEGNAFVHDWAHPCHVCWAEQSAGTALAAAAIPTSAPRLGSPLPHLQWDRARRCHICTGTGPSAAPSRDAVVGGSCRVRAHDVRVSATVIYLRVMYAAVMRRYDVQVLEPDRRCRPHALGAVGPRPVHAQHIQVPAAPSVPHSTRSRAPRAWRMQPMHARAAGA